MTGNVSSLLHLSRDQGMHHFQMQLPLPTGGPGSLSHCQVDAPEGHPTHFCFGRGPAEDGEPRSACAHQQVGGKDVPEIHKTIG